MSRAPGALNTTGRAGQNEVEDVRNYWVLKVATNWLFPVPADMPPGALAQSAGSVPVPV